MSAGLGQRGAASGLVRGTAPVNDWSSIRHWVLERDNWVCQICFRSNASDVDHIWPRRLGGTDYVGNLQAACGPCNKAKGDRVSPSSASPEHLRVAVTALESRVDALNAELEQFETELMVRVMLNPDDSRGHLVGLASHITAQIELLSYRQARMCLVLDESDAVLDRRDAEVSASPDST